MEGVAASAVPLRPTAGVKAAAGGVAGNGHSTTLGLAAASTSRGGSASSHRGLKA